MSPLVLPPPALVPTDSSADSSADTPTDSLPRLSKVLAQAGAGSRRQADAWIKEGRARVNGAIVRNPAMRPPEGATLTLNDAPIRPRSRLATPRLWLVHKPRGVLSAPRPGDPRRDILTMMPKGLPRLICPGRLDLLSEGLLPLTDNGDFARHLALPASGYVRVYRMRVFGLTPQTLAKMRAGVVIDGERIRAVALRRVSGLEGDTPSGAQRTANAWVEAQLTQGRNRFLRKLAEAADLKVSRLVRLRFGSMVLGRLHAGGMTELTPDVVRRRFAAFFKGR